MFFYSAPQKLFSLGVKKSSLNYKSYQSAFSVQVKKNFKIFLKSGESSIDNLLNWIERNKNQKDKLIGSINKAGIGFLKATSFPSKKEESYKFFFPIESFQTNLLENKKKFKPNFSVYTEHNEICIHFSNQSHRRENTPVDKKSLQGFYFGTLNELQDSEKKNIIDISDKGESSVNGGFFSALNAACLDEVFILIVSENFDLKKKISLIFEKSEFDNNVYSNQKLVIIIKKNTTCEISQYSKNINCSKCFDNMVTSVIIEENSKLKYYLVCKNSKLTTHISSTHVQLKKSTCLELFTLFSGGKSRNNLGIDINGINSSIKIKGVSVANESEIIDFHSRISHNYPESKSSQLHKNLVSDSAHVIFAGKIQIHSGAFNIEAKQLSKTLLLSSKSKIDVAPVLEINNQNVKCTHGSTVADIDKNQLFYLESRGISTEMASKLLKKGFIIDIIEDFPSNIKV